MKICVIGDGLLSNDFARLNFKVIDTPCEDFTLDSIKGFDVVINTYEYGRRDGEDDIAKMVECNVNLPKLLSEYGAENHIRYVHISTTDLCSDLGEVLSEDSEIGTETSFLACKLLGEHVCNKSDIIIRTKNLFNDLISTDNALYNTLIASSQSNNIDSYTWTVDLIRGIVKLLRKRKAGVYNLVSSDALSQVDICKHVGIRDITPYYDNNGRYDEVECAKIHRYYLPNETMDALTHCYTKLVDKLKD